MKKTRIAAVVLCLVLLLSLCDCGKRSAEPSPAVSEKPVPTENSAVITMATPVPTVTPVPLATPVTLSTPVPSSAAVSAATPVPVSTPVTTPVTVSTPIPSATPLLSSVPTPQPSVSSPPGYPVVTKHPTDETVNPDGSCWFVAKYQNAKWAVWHFVSPDGQKDLTYLEVVSEFPGLSISKGYASTTHLFHIPAEMNGWRAYCTLSNDLGSVNTNSALITVKGAGTAATSASPAPASSGKASGAPTVTKHPTDETVNVDGSCWFVCKYENAKWAEWFFLSPDGKDISYKNIQSEFPTLVVSKGYASTTHIFHIPAEMNGWRAYCKLSNDVGSVNTNAALITVKGAGSTQISPSPTPTVSPVAPVQPPLSGQQGIQQGIAGDTNHYSGVTSMTKEMVEIYAATARRAYLAEDWNALSSMIRYPTTLAPDLTLTTKDEFLLYMSDKTVTAKDAAAMREETCSDMFVNGQGICMGSGQIWFLDVNYMTGNAPLLQVISLSGFETAGAVVLSGNGSTP